MYLIPDMIDMGLAIGQQWPSEPHRVVAQSIAIGNSDVRTRERLAEICQAVIAIPLDRIKHVTVRELRWEFRVPV